MNAVDSAGGQNGYIVNVGNQQSFHDADDGHNEPFYDTYDGHLEAEGNTADQALSEKILGNSLQRNIDVHSHGEAVQLINKDGVNALRIGVSGDPKTDETISDDKYPESSIKIASDNISCASGTWQDEDIGINQNMNLFQESVDSGHLGTEFGTATNKESDQGKSCGDGNNSVVGPASLTVHDPTRSPLESNSQLLVLHDMYGSDLEKLDASLPKNTASKMETASNIVGTEDESALNASISQSSQIHIIDVLEEIIADARNNKVSVVSNSYSF